MYLVKNKKAQLSIYPFENGRLFDVTVGCEEDVSALDHHGSVPDVILQPDAILTHLLFHPISV